ncbi:hypothetical protein ACWGE0_31735 [Lentzea sp. NPDC054927]
MARRSNPDQLDLFGETPQAADIVPAPRTAPKVGFGGKADAVVEVLDQVHNGRFGLMSATDRVVYLDGEGRCRHASEADATVVESLVAQRYAKPAYVEHMRHGVINKAVALLVLTPGGLGLLRRSSVLRTRTPR